MRSQSREFVGGTGRHRAPLIGLAVGLLVVLVVSVGFLLGNHTPQVSVLVGRAYSAPSEIAVEASGIWYAVPLHVTWFGPNGGEHQGERPPCLPPTGTINGVKFGATQVISKGGPWNLVVWVSCP